MADINLNSRAQGAGIPVQWEQKININDQELITGNEPAILTQDLPFAASQTIPALTPVGFNGSNLLVPAVNGTTKAIGVTVRDLVTPASGDPKGFPVYRCGCLNPRALNWPASYDTEAKQFAAFEGSPTPTNIIMRRPKTANPA